MTDLQKEQITSLRLQGAGYVKIGKMLGISNNTVRSFCRRAGLDGDSGKNTVPCKQCGKKFKVNRGELPMYHAENSHEAIIPMAEFQEAQQVRKERAEVYRHDADRSIIYPFRGKLLCMDCGKHYRRKTVRRGPVWICATYNSKGKEFCPTSKAIPEETLMTVTARVLGTDSFDGELFRERVARIEVRTDNQLTYIFSDGTTMATFWEDRSRKESWTEDKREAARQAAMKQGVPGRNSDGKFKKKNSVCVLPSCDCNSDHAE